MALPRRSTGRRSRSSPSGPRPKSCSAIRSALAHPTACPPPGAPSLCDSPWHPWHRRATARRQIEPEALCESIKELKQHPEAFDLLKKFFNYDPKKRISALDAMKEPYFRKSPPPPARPALRARLHLATSLHRAPSRGSCGAAETRALRRAAVLSMRHVGPQAVSAGQCLPGRTRKTCRPELV